MKVVPVKVGQVRIVADHLPMWKPMAGPLVEDFLRRGWMPPPAMLLTPGTVVMLVDQHDPPSGFLAGRWYELLIDGVLRVSRYDLINDRTWLLE